MLKRLPQTLVASITCLAILATSATAQEAKKKAASAKTHKVTAGLFEVIEEVAATVESKNMTPLSPKMDIWTALEIAKIVPEGATVQKGDEVIAFDTAKLDRKMRDSKLGVTQARFAFETAELEMKLFEKTFELDKNLAEREAKQAEEDFKYYMEVEKPNNIESARRNVMNSQHSLEYTQEEFNQLKRMYDEDELTEESEEIILTRTKRDVENRQYYLKQAEIRTNRTLNVAIPRESTRQKDALERARLVNERSKIALPMDAQKKRVAVEKAETAYRHLSEDFKKLDQDRLQMQLVAPVSGVVYYGQCERGKWKGQAGPTRALEAGKAVTANKPVVTLVDIENLMLRADLTEKQIGMIKPNLTGIAKPKAFPNATIPAEVKSVNYVPLAADKFDCQIELGQTPTGLMPGMTCTVRFVAHRNDSALTVPTSSLFSDDGILHYVFMKDGKRRPVNIGLATDGKTEILSGLSDGVEILLKRPSN